MGYDWFDFSVLFIGCIVCNVYGYESVMVEFVFVVMFEWEIRMCEIEVCFWSGSWCDWGIFFNGCVYGELCDKMVGLIGYGVIFWEIVCCFVVFDMMMIVVSCF